MREIKPALTAAEWTTARFSPAGFWNLFPLYVDGVYQPQNAPKLAALLLDDEPFGFTREMVNALHRLVGLGVENGVFIDRPDFDGPLKDLAHEALANLEALLPLEDA